MYYYDILIADIAYKGSNLLTYASKEQLRPLQVVVAQLRNKQALAIVIQETTRPPSVSVIKEVSRVVTHKPLPGWYVEIISWLADYYPVSRSEAAYATLPGGLRTYNPSSKRALSSIHDKHLDDIPTSVKPPLTNQQKEAFDVVRTTGDTSILLHGITGSGKTRIYIELIKETLSEGKSVFVLTPEISLTPQLQKNIEAYFGNRVHVTHSGLTTAKRRDAWLQVLYQTEPIIVIGPRSALFMPVHHIGLIIIDEAHDLSYKQDQLPHYHASRVAAALAKKQQAKLVLGTATPSIVDFFTFSSKKLPIAVLDKKAITQEHAVSKHVIDTADRSLFTGSSWVADSVLDAIKQAIRNGEQSLVYINRRGTARLVLCQACTWQATCPTCDMNYVYHGDTHQLRCHTCGTSRKAYTSCPECSSSDIILRSAGTKLIQTELARLLPNARMARFDTDSDPGETMEQMYAQLHKGDIDIAVGTQIIGKGLDLPGLRVVAILQADSALTLPDYVAEEELFQHIHQLIGRIGRGHRAGQAFIQTRQPKHPVIASALSGNYMSFYQAELKKREKHSFPPFSHLLKVYADRSTRARSQAFLESIKKRVIDNYNNVTVLGPAPSYKEKVGSSYRWQMIISSPRRDSLVEITRELPGNCHYDIDPSRML